MHPAPSIIFFTVASGAGYGLLFLLGVLAPTGVLPTGRGFALVGLGLAVGLVSLGLVSSVFHLGRSDRAWRALSQWRSSWLSREGALALLTYLPTAALALGWVVFGQVDGWWAVAGLLTALGAAGTVWCTSMISASLQPIARWHHPLTAPVFLAFALMTGGLCLTALIVLFGANSSWLAAFALATIALAWMLKAAHWRAGDGPSTLETATGLGAIGRVRLLEPPHSGESYLTHEMGFRVARKHAAKLRRLALLLGAGLPVALTLALFGLEGWAATAAAVLALAPGGAGVLIERWLFFAEARHTASLYYGERGA